MLVSVSGVLMEGGCGLSNARVVGEHKFSEQNVSEQKVSRHLFAQPYCDELTPGIPFDD